MSGIILHELSHWIQPLYELDTTISILPVRKYRLNKYL